MKTGKKNVIHGRRVYEKIIYMYNLGKKEKKSFFCFIYALRFMLSTYYTKTL